jgi:misacylated tRNA(Ala) deacylase
MTELLYLRDAYLTSFTATVVDVRGGDGDDAAAIALDRTAFYPTGGGQPHDTGTLAGRDVVDVRKEGQQVWHTLAAPVDGALPAVGDMEPLAARMDFEFDPVPDGFGPRIEQLVNEALAADHPIEVLFLPRDTAVQDDDLIRTKVSLIPESVTEIRVVDIVGLDKQADGGTHVRSTNEVGRIRVTKLENKGKGNKRVRLEIVDA